MSQSVEFHPATAEQLIGVVDAVVVWARPATKTEIADFADLSPVVAEAALRLAAKVGFVVESTNGWEIASPLAKYVSSRKESQRAAALRVLLEEFEPFCQFRRRLLDTADEIASARAVKVLLNLDARHDEIRDTLVSLGTYAQALVATGGGRHRVVEDPAENPLETVGAAVRDQVSAERNIVQQLGNLASQTVSHDEVVSVLADALVHAADSDGVGAVVRAGNAVESHLAEYGARIGANLSGATGLNAKAEKLAQHGGPARLPKKLLNWSKYLGHIRNAADHGTDSDVGSSWKIDNRTGLEYVFVSCSFIRASVEWEKNQSAHL